MGGKTDDSSSREMINMQKEEAAQARAKEEARKARIAGGLAKIKEAFSGKVPMKDVATSTKLAGPGAGTAVGGVVPGMEGYTYVRGPATPAATKAATTATAAANKAANDARSAARGTSANRSVPGTGAGATVQTPQGEWMVKGPDGKLHKIGDTVSGTKSVKAGKAVDPFKAQFDEYQQAMLDYYGQDVAKQYQDAQDELTYRLADAGQLRSGVAATETADLAGQNVKNVAKVKQSADEATGKLKTRVATEKQNAINQLYATENPEVASNQATAAVTNISAENPDLSPLGAVFDIASIGGAGLLKGANNAYYRNQINSGGSGRYGATKVV